MNEALANGIDCDLAGGALDLDGDEDRVRILRLGCESCFDVDQVSVGHRPVELKAYCSCGERNS